MSPLSKGETGLGCSPFGPISLAWLGTRTVNTTCTSICVHCVHACVFQPLLGMLVYRSVCACTQDTQGLDLELGLSSCCCIQMTFERVKVQLLLFLCAVVVCNQQWLQHKPFKLWFTGISVIARPRILASLSFRSSNKLEKYTDNAHMKLQLYTWSIE